MAVRRTFLVTGGNKGIGYYIARGIALAGKKDGSTQVVLACRDSGRGRDAVEALHKEGLDNVDLIAPLALDDPSTIETAVAAFMDRYGALDVLVNNAGFAYKMSATEPVSEQARVTCKINYNGTNQVTEAFLPLLREAAKKGAHDPRYPRPRVINVASRAGLLSKITDDALRARFEDPSLTFAQLDALVEQYIAVAAKDDPAALGAAGWPSTTYGMSKIALSAATRVMSRDVMGVLTVAMCPGWCKTDMAGDKAPRSAEEGAETGVWLALEDEKSLRSGAFYGEKHEISYGGQWDRK
eukprot:TRINITY_DN6959_c0_g1_i1.p1 TRINITY_DN6959_c0_g1~~TRINITY_DN6959_c0_g1_i1.p1  ORF type:complete len:297 (-),score=75.25 TRINITY_DN6959_c0_g1_i1:90-980(-)